MRYAIIESNRVVNVAEADPAFAAEFGWIPGENCEVGDVWDGVRFARPEPAMTVPNAISPRQFRQALTHFGLRATVESAVAVADQDTRDWYEFATQFERSHPRVIGMAQLLGFLDAQVDQVWIYGAAI